MSGHSVMFGPSSSHTWLKCPYSAFARSKLPNRSTSYTEAGTLAHELCEIKVKLAFGQMTADEFSQKLAAIEANALYDPAMKGNSEMYLDTIRELATAYFNQPPFIAVERKVSYTSVCGDDGFGTSDCLLYGGSTLVVVDYKNGAGVPVSAVNNPQMKLYALGALQSVLDPLVYDIQKIVLCIVQPNISETASVWETTTDDLMAWVETTLKPAVKNIKEENFYKRAGHWCKDGFCPNYINCTEWRAKFASVYADFETEGKELDLDSLSNDELGELYTKVYAVKEWMKKIQDKVEYLVTKGTNVKGWKMVAGRSKRIFTDPDGVEQALKAAGLDPAMTHTTPTLLALTKIEALMGKKNFAATCGAYIGTATEKPAVVSENDPRQALNSAASDFADVAPAPVEKETEKATPDEPPRTAKKSRKTAPKKDTPPTT